MDRFQLVILLLIPASIASSIADTEPDWEREHNCRRLANRTTLKGRSDTKLIMPYLHGCGWKDPKIVDVEFSKDGDSFDATAQIDGVSIETFPVYISKNKKSAAGTIAKLVKGGKVKVSVGIDTDTVNVNVKSTDFGHGFPKFTQCADCDQFSNEERSSLLGAFEEYAKIKVSSDVSAFIKERMETLLGKYCKCNGSTDTR